MIKPGHMLLNETNATSSLPLDQQAIYLSRQVADLVETIQNDIDILTHTRPDSRLNTIESKLQNVESNVMRLGGVLSEVAKKQNALAEQVEKMDKVFQFLFERKKGTEDDAT